MDTLQYAELYQIEFYLRAFGVSVSQKWYLAQKNHRIPFNSRNWLRVTNLLVRAISQFSQFLPDLLQIFARSLQVVAKNSLN